MNIYIIRTKDYDDTYPEERQVFIVKATDEVEARLIVYLNETHYSEQDIQDMTCEEFDEYLAA